MVGSGTEDISSKKALFYKLQGLYHFHCADNIKKLVKDKERINYEKMLSEQRAIISLEASLGYNPKDKDIYDLIHSIKN